MQTWRLLRAAGATLATGLRAPARAPAERAPAGTGASSGAVTPPERTGGATPPEPPPGLAVEPSGTIGLPDAEAALRAALQRAGVRGVRGAADVSAAELRDMAASLLAVPDALFAMVAYLEAAGEACRPASPGAVTGEEAEYAEGPAAADYLESATLFTVLAPSYVAGLARLMARAPRAPTFAWQEAISSVRRQVSPSAWPEFCAMVERLLPPDDAASQADLWRAVQALADVPAAARRHFVETIAPTPAVWEHMDRLATTEPALLAAHRDALLVGVAPDRALYAARRAVAEATPDAPTRDPDVAAGAAGDVAPPSDRAPPRHDARTGLQYAALLAVVETPWPVDGSTHPAHSPEALATLMALSQDPAAWAALAPEKRHQFTLLGLCHLLLMPDLVVPASDAAPDTGALPWHREAARTAFALLDWGRSLASAMAAQSAGRPAVEPRRSEVLAFIVEHELLWVRHLVVQAVALNPAAEAGDDTSPGALRRALRCACDEISLVQALISERLEEHRGFDEPYSREVMARLDARVQPEDRRTCEIETLLDARMQLQHRLERFQGEYQIL